MTIQLVVFDMAGTTVKDNDNVHAALQKAFAMEGISVSRNEANDVMGYPKPVAIYELLKLRGHANPEEAFIQQVFRNFQNEMVNYYQHAPEVREIEGVSQLFDVLRKNRIKVAIDTGFDRRIADTILKRLGWQEKGLLDVSITSDEVARGRPYPDMIFRAMELTGVTDAKQVAKVGDTASDLQQGTAAGCRFVVGVTTGAFTKEALVKEPHTHIISQLSELLPLMNIASVAAE
ncbi:phosphonatase-like hydrolase [Rhodocytophaga aerolata]|uniref:Phosphonatase-like hydrolase n=1 Tax=Rhodocytophaga aerolata TaxID=455078 RepID=A0ABT8RCR2_9BACT|nr:phosphonatase-like hydrolase [Rhodocytophaga aerolata]MDO1448978.1 phosphonatase-like hydrolase [Rhodocytophaga aerolata]